jgi:hypothetical protein
MLGARSDRSTTLLVEAPLLGFALWLIARIAKRAFRSLPPGPKGLPIVGDVLHIADQDWLASPKRKDEYGDIHSLCIQKSAHDPFRRNDVCKRPRAGSPRHQQPTRCCRFTGEAIQHILRSTTLHFRRRIRNKEPATFHDTVWRRVRHRYSDLHTC